MNYPAALTDFFKSPKWFTNLLLGAICVLIPVVGPMVLVGWHVGALFGRRSSSDFVSYPAFDFNDFGKHLGRGVWPFLVTFVPVILLVPVIWVMTIFSIAVLVAVGAPEHAGSASEASGALVGLGILFIVGINAFLVLLVTFLMKPIMIRAAMVQDFGQAFNIQFIKDFTARTWGAQIVSMIFLFAVGILVMVGGMMVFCVGSYAAAGLMIFIQWHLDRQLYDLYLIRGGAPVPFSPKLFDTPPPLIQ